MHGLRTTAEAQALDEDDVCSKKLGALTVDDSQREKLVNRTARRLREEKGRDSTRRAPAAKIVGTAERQP